ncbi:metallophosphoesterase [Bacilliculturomica massiliensis]|uniref:metallophosphoesterase n=1 Tax=Bacilliculturomica massiliensis TaxID=1917867 RepID=UPI00103226D2|nr:metallophosphoesterase [Bacilliculturomica massiliensis]
MSVYAIGDLHLSFGELVEKPMDIYGGQWIGHAERVKENWEQLVKEEDTVIIPGDISWGLRFEEALPDLRWISALPGKKVLLKGNHDLWWSSISKLSKLDEKLYFVQNNCYADDSVVVCGSRGWICPGNSDFTQRDRKLYDRELLRLRLSLEDGKKLRRRAAEEGRELPLIGALHFPPTNEKFESSGFTELFEEYGASKVIYGHLHGTDAFKNGLQGRKGNIEYLLTSCDKLACRPVLLLD